MKANKTVKQCIEKLTECCERVESLRIDREMIDEDMQTHYLRMEALMEDLRESSHSRKQTPQIVEMHVHGLGEVTL